MASIVELLQLSPTMTEGTLVKWKVKEGDTIKSGQIIAEVETDKAVMDHETFDAGVVRKLLVAEGSKAAVGSGLMIVGTKDEDISSLVASAGSAPKAAPAADKKPVATAAKPASAPRSAPRSVPGANKPAPAPAATKVASAPPAKTPAPSGANGHSERLFASPLARKVAAEAGLDIGSVSGTGPGGRIIKRDVDTALAAGPATAGTSSFRVSGEVQELPLSNVRRIIASRLVESKVTVPHYQLSVEIRAEALLEAQARVRKMYPDVKITVTHFLVKAMALLAMRHPAIRTQWADDHVKLLPSANITVAVATDDGLITPVLRDVHAKGLLQIVAEMAELVERARKRRVKPEELTGGVQTLSNLGMFPIDFFTAIINPPESSILAVGAVQEKVFVKDGQMTPGKSFSITMSCDHRIIDGAVGAKYLADLKASLEEPYLLLL